MLSHTVCITFTNENTFDNCKLLLIGSDQTFKRNDALQRPNCGGNYQRKFDLYCRKCFQWTTDGHNLRNHPVGLMCGDLRNFFLAQKKTSVKRHQALELTVMNNFWTKYSLTMDLEKEFKKDLPKLELKDVQGQYCSKFLLSVALSYAWNGSIRWPFELSHRKLSLSTTTS